MDGSIEGYLLEVKRYSETARVQNRAWKTELKKDSGKREKNCGI